MLQCIFFGVGKILLDDLKITIKSPKLLDFDKLRRFLWCRKNENNDFKNHPFVDESHVRILEVPLYHVRLPGERPEAIPCSTKIRLKINVWGESQ
jgi:hypothetical protein